MRGNQGRRTLIVVPAALLILLAPACGRIAGGQQGARLTGVVTRVADGDTLDVSIDGRAVTVRLDGIDAPEGGQRFSDEARRHLRVVAFSQRVTLVGRDTDRYGRLVARILVGPVDASEEMVRAGLAWHFTRYSKDERLARLEAAARAKRTGLWADPSPIPPWTWRSGDRAGRSTPPVPTAPRATPPRPLPPDTAAAAPGPYHGNVSSGAYHAPSCRDYNCKRCTRVFANRQEAESAGFRAHRECVFPAK